MGRYYTGDIEGKFWFAIQDSNDATHFGGTHDYVDGEGEVCEDEDQEPSEIFSHFETEDLPDIEDHLNFCLTKLGDCKPIIETLLNSERGFYDSDEYIKTHFGHLGITTFSAIKPMLVIYARYQLGQKILDRVEMYGECNFSSEL